MNKSVVKLQLKKNQELNKAIIYKMAKERARVFQQLLEVKDCQMNGGAD